MGSELKRLAEGRAAAMEWVFTDVPGLDIADGGQVASFFADECPEVVVNCAAWTDVDRAESDRDGAFRINADGPANLADAALTHNTVLIHISTDFVFGNGQTTPYTEDDKPCPLNAYGESKLAGERAVLDSGCRGAVVRTSWLYSPYGRNFVKSIMRAAAANPEIRVVGDQWGNPTAADGLAGAIVDMIPRLLQTGEPAGLYHYCDRGVVNRSGFAEEIVRLSGADCRVVPVLSSEYAMAAERPLYSALDTARIGRVFGIVPRRWQDALAECVERMGDN